MFVEFSDFESVDKFLKADPKPTWEDKELLIMTKYEILLMFFRSPLIVNYHQGGVLRDENQRKGPNGQERCSPP